MKRNIFKIAVILLISLGNIFISCEDKEKYPKEIATSDYPVYTGSMCNWINQEYDGKVKIINSDEELKEYVSCYENYTYPAIDFSKYSLLLIGGTASAGIYEIQKEKMQQISPNEYVLSVIINLSEATKPLEWNKALIINKLRQDAKIELKVDELSATSIIGKWKLMKKDTWHEGVFATFDYSQYNVIYEFNTSGILTISGDYDNECTILKIGNHPYSIGNYKELVFNDEDPFRYFISSNELEIRGSCYVSSEYSYFVKLKN